MTKDVFIGLGSNLGDREGHLQDAIEMIGKKIGEILSFSNIYETEPWGFKSDDKFLNMVVRIKTNHGPLKLMKEIIKIEKGLGKTRPAEGYESRIIDMDILICGEKVISEAGLKIPHPLIGERKFVLVPLCDLSPEGIHPVSGKSFSAMLEECNDKCEVNLYKRM